MLNPTGSNSCFPDGSQSLQPYNITEDASTSSSPESFSSSLLYNLSILKEKVQQIQSMMSICISTDPNQPDTTGMAMASINTSIQEIIMAASSMLFITQQMTLSEPTTATITTTNEGDFYSGTTFDWYADNYNNCQAHCSNRRVVKELHNKGLTQGNTNNSRNNTDYNDIIEVEAADLLAKYTHYCQVCGKGFKRDANLRMHMRAHGDEYKTMAALSNPMKINSGISGNKDEYNPLVKKKYSCPQEGCRWNRKHARFQPLKSMICVKNHYKRSHCPKMYVCKRCNSKQFSVLSDLRTHEKHCGVLKWLCSCGTTFSRKDKLMGHVALFVGHTPVSNPLQMKPSMVDYQCD